MNGIAKRALVALAFASSSALGGCAHEHPAEEPTSPASGTETTSVLVPAPARHAGLNISEAILKACKIHFDDVEAAPKFDFDESYVRPEERTVLAKVAACLTTGPLKGRELRLVGRAYPRGEIEYNFTLGASRAASVASYLEERGLPSSRVTTTSRGKLDATGTDETGWQLDRRVDLDLK